ncbi:class II aldolase/adducin family protein [Blastococcus sp. SYSU D00820]
MTFVPTADKLVPELTPAEEIVLLARTLWREGYDDHLAGHITYALGDGTLLCNPWLLTWQEFRARDVLRIDLDGNVLEGDWPVPLGIPLHLELHRLRPDVRVAVHNHPRFGLAWAGLREVPPVYDQSSGLGGGGELVLVDEYEGGVNDAGAARRAVEAMGDAELALLAGHGVFVLGPTVAAVHLRAVSLEQRCRSAWMVRAAGGRGASAVPEAWLARKRAGDGSGFPGLWESSVRAELRADPTLLG